MSRRHLGPRPPALCGCCICESSRIERAWWTLLGQAALSIGERVELITLRRRAIGPEEVTS